MPFSLSTPSHSLALGLSLLSIPLIQLIGLRFLLAPKTAAAGYGLPLSDVRAFTFIKGIRDITSGVIPLVLYYQLGEKALGYTMMAVSITPIGDALVVIARGGEAGKGSVSTGLGVHGITAGMLIWAGWTLVTKA